MIILIGICVAEICFTICVCLSLLFLWDVVPWMGYVVDVQAVFICFAALYVPIVPCVLAQMCLGKGVWSKSKTRMIAGFLIGTSLGFFIPGMRAIFGENGLGQFHTDSFERLLCGGVSPQPIWEQARNVSTTSGGIRNPRVGTCSSIPLALTRFLPLKCSDLSRPTIP
jgi:hypothetical protein